LIFPIIDRPNVETDKDLFEKILAKHRNLDSSTTRPIGLSLLRKYLFYVSQYIQPKITDEAETKLYNYFEKMRDNGNGNGNKTISITPRQIEGLIRISEAYAKLRMSDKVLICDVEKAISLVDYYLECFALDPATNKIDIDRIQSGISSSERNLWNKVKMIIAELEKKYGSLIPIEDVVKKAKDDESIPEEDVESSIERLKKDGDIMESRPGFVQRV
jgi:replicative DNA helicase Mcm